MASISGGDSRPEIQGGTDGTPIGNTGDRLRVETQPNLTVSNLTNWTHTLRYEDMNASTGGVARGSSISTSSTWTNVYSYTGSGYFAGFILNVETFTGWEFRLQIDGDTIFSLADSDITGDAIYDLDDVTDANQIYLGISKGSHDRLAYHAPMNSPISYSTSVTISIRRPTAGAKKFQAGLVTLSKDS